MSDARGIVNSRDGSALAIYRQAKADLEREGRLERIAEVYPKAAREARLAGTDPIERAFRLEGMDVGVPNPNACPTCGYAFADGRETPDCILA